ncbi:AAC(3) family N-acetyltransferase [Deltaproteobacteria bacterium TL4]
MKHYSLNTLKQAFHATGLSKGDVVMVHSALFLLGAIEGVAFKAIPYWILETLRECLGPEGTIVVPAFRYDYEFFMGLRLPMGPLSEYLQTLDNCQKSTHPIHRVAAIGKLAVEICSADTLSGFDEKGPFGVMLKNKAKILLLGASMDSISLVHFAEERVTVPYRYWKDFPVSNDTKEPMPEKIFKMYVRDLKTYPKLYLSKIEDWLIKGNQIQQFPVGGGKIKVCQFTDYLNTVIPQIQQHPTIFLNK